MKKAMPLDKNIKFLFVKPDQKHNRNRQINSPKALGVIGIRPYSNPDFAPLEAVESTHVWDRRSRASLGANPPEMAQNRRIWIQPWLFGPFWSSKKDSSNRCPRHFDSLAPAFDRNHAWSQIFIKQHYFDILEGWFIRSVISFFFSWQKKNQKSQGCMQIQRFCQNLRRPCLGQGYDRQVKTKLARLRRPQTWFCLAAVDFAKSGLA